MHPRRAVFLDRDGTINEDPGYLSDPAQLKLYPGVGDALGLLKRGGFALVVVSNQSGVGRGLIAPENLPRIHERLARLLEPSGVSIDHYELCLHTPEDQCPCRKPKPELLIQAARKLGIDVGSSYMVGDKASDLEAGRAAGCRDVVLVRTGEGKKAEESLTNDRQPGFIADSLPEAARWILSRET